MIYQYANRIHENFETAHKRYGLKSVILVALIFVYFFFLSACSSTGGSKGRYHQALDTYPSGTVDISQVKDAVPRVEPLSKSGNPTRYQVFNQTYYVKKSAKGYREKGYASFYGTKFHGYATSNGEAYNMYAMSAAHKTLPLPTYVRVTNLNNQRSVIVRVNDRGPFVANRIIDLSYAAASKLDMLKQGTAPVLVEAIDPREPVTSSYPASQSSGNSVSMPQSQNVDANVARNFEASNQPRFADQSLISGDYLQLGAFQLLSNAQQLAQNLKSLVLNWPLHVLKRDQLYRLWIGPFANHSEINQAKQQITQLGYANAITVRYRR